MAMNQILIFTLMVLLALTVDARKQGITWNICVIMYHIAYAIVKHQTQINII